MSSEPRPPRIDAANLLAGVTALALVPPVLSLFGALWWPLELTMHFHGCYALALAPLSLLLWLTRHRALAGVATAMLLVDLAHVAPLYVSPGETRSFVAEGPTVRILFANVYTENRDPRRLLQLIEDEAPDCVALFEVDERWLAALRGLGDRYSWRAARARADNFGIAFWSKLPCTRIETVTLGDAGVPSVHADLRIGDGAASGAILTIIATHPIPPVLHRAPTARERQLQAVADHVAALPHRAVVVGGDLNTSSWTPIFGRLCDQAGLRDSRRGFGIQPTWPGRFSRIGIAIDHALVGDDIEILDRRVGRNIGSDHRPVLIDVRRRRLEARF